MYFSVHVSENTAVNVKQTSLGKVVHYLTNAERVAFFDETMLTFHSSPISFLKLFCRSILCVFDHLVRPEKPLVVKCTFN